GRAGDVEVGARRPARVHARVALDGARRRRTGTAPGARRVGTEREVRRFGNESPGTPLAFTLAFTLLLNEERLDVRIDAGPQPAVGGMAAHGEPTALGRHETIPFDPVLVRQVFA